MRFTLGSSGPAGGCAVEAGAIIGLFGGADGCGTLLLTSEATVSNCVIFIKEELAEREATRMQEKKVVKQQGQLMQCSSPRRRLLLHFDDIAAYALATAVGVSGGIYSRVIRRDWERRMVQKMTMRQAAHEKKTMIQKNM